MWLDCAMIGMKAEEGMTGPVRRRRQECQIKPKIPIWVNFGRLRNAKIWYIL
jgi:hypothetical protein